MKNYGDRGGYRQLRCQLMEVAQHAEYAKILLVLTSAIDKNRHRKTNGNKAIIVNNHFLIDIDSVSLNR